MAGPASALEGMAALPGRRLRYRQKISTLAYLNLDHANGGIIRDLSEAGLAVQAVSPLRLNQSVHLRFDLLRPRLHVETAARVCWADGQGQAGLEFQNLPLRSRSLLKQWIFIQLLVRAQQAAQLGSIFVPDKPQEANAAELVFSGSTRPAIRIEPCEPDIFASALRQSLPSKRAPVSFLQFLARFADGLLLGLAVMLFFVLAINITRAIPAWPVMIAVGFPVACLFAALYWFLFSVHIGGTPGDHLARLVIREPTVKAPADDRVRFR